MRFAATALGPFLAAGLALAAAGPALAEWPEKPIEIVISFAPGGGMDQTMLPLKPLLEERLGQPVNLNYKPGAGGRIGFETVHMNGKDGYVIGALSEPHFTNSTIFDTPAYTHDDLVPVGIIGRDVPIWFVRKDSPYKDLNDLIAAARARPGEITVATGSFTGEQYLSVAILEEQAGVQFRAVNVGGGGPVMTNVLGGHFDVGVIRPASLSGIADEVRGLAVLATERSPLFPEAQTFREQLPDTIKVPLFSSTRGLMVAREFAEANPAAVAKLEAALEDAVRSPEYQDALARMGFPFEWHGSAEARAEMKETAAAMQKYKPLVEAAKTRK
jgi:tripartite-type tricarboxylate transporter receptor subunit TctC